MLYLFGADVDIIPLQLQQLPVRKLLGKIENIWLSQLHRVPRALAVLRRGRNCPSQTGRITMFVLFHTNSLPADALSSHETVSARRIAVSSCRDGIFAASL